MNHKVIAAEIYAESQGQKSTSAATRFRTQALTAYKQEDRVMIRAYMDNIARANHVSGRSPNQTFNDKLERK